MRLLLLSPLILILIICSCHQSERAIQSALIDSTIKAIVEGKISIKSTRYFSSFKTHMQAQFYGNGRMLDFINANDYDMMSWYSIHKDTIDLVAHIGNFETAALLLRFVGHQIIVRYLRAPHNMYAAYFKVNENDSFVNHIEVPPYNYILKLSSIPDPQQKQPVYGYINMESADFYDKRDTTGGKHKVKMNFYFRSQYRDFNY